MNPEKDRPRPQISENRARPRLVSPRETNTGHKISKLLCCICMSCDNEDACRVESDQQKKPGEILADIRRALRETDRKDLSSAILPQADPSSQNDRSRKSRIGYHRAGVVVPVLYGSANPHSSSSSDTEFHDARDHFSDSEVEKESEIASLEAPVRHTSSNVRHWKRSESETIGVVHERKKQESFSTSNVCDRLYPDKESKVEFDLNLKVVEYDIRTGEVEKEWKQELNLSEEPLPVGEMRNPQVENDINIRRTRARETIRSLFLADQYVSISDDFDDDDEHYDGDGEPKGAEIAVSRGDSDELSGSEGGDCFLQPVMSENPSLG